MSISVRRARTTQPFARPSHKSSATQPTLILFGKTESVSNATEEKKRCILHTNIIYRRRGDTIGQVEIGLTDVLQIKFAVREEKCKEKHAFRLDREKLKLTFHAI